MRHILASVFLIVLLFPALALGSEVKWDELVMTDGLPCKKSVTGEGRSLVRSFKDGKRDGPWVVYWKNGQLWSKETYTDGKEDGPWVRYNKDGTVNEKHTGIFKDGVKISDWPHPLVMVHQIFHHGFNFFWSISRWYWDMASTWSVHLCLEKISDNLFELCIGWYEVIAEANEFYDEETDELVLPEVIDGVPVLGTEDGLVIGGTIVRIDSEGVGRFSDIQDPDMRAWLEDVNWNDSNTIAAISGALAEETK